MRNGVCVIITSSERTSRCVTFESERFAANSLFALGLLFALRCPRHMCRSIKTLANFEPPATDDEIRAAAVQFVRKLSGTTRPSRANEATFDRAVDAVTATATRLIHQLDSTTAPRNAEIAAATARSRR